MPALQVGQGIAAVVIESEYPLAQLTMVPDSGKGDNLYVPSIPAGRNVYLFVAPSGVYCMHQFHAGSGTYTAKENDQCFDVVQGKLSYGGNFTPIPGLGVSDVGGGMSQGGDMQEFMILLSQRYPKIAAVAFPTGQDKSVANSSSGRSLIGICDLLSQQDAGDLLGLAVNQGVISNGFNSQTCTYSHSKKEGVSLTLLPGGDYKLSNANGDGSSIVMISGNGHSVMLAVSGYSGINITDALNKATAKIKANLEKF